MKFIGMRIRFSEHTMSVLGSNRISVTGLRLTTWILNKFNYVKLIVFQMRNGISLRRMRQILKMLSAKL
jgi:hypothetical protein